MEEPKQKNTASLLEKIKYFLPVKKTHKILLGIIALAVTVSVTFFAMAVPKPVWVATTSGNCPVQGNGNTFTFATVGGKEYLYVLPGGATTFLRYDPAGINGGTGDCEETALAPLLASTPATYGADMEAVDYDGDGEDDFIYTFVGGSGGNFYVYDIANNEWIVKTRSIYNEDTKELIPEHSEVTGTIEQVMGAYDNNVYISSEVGNNHFLIYDTATNTWSNSSSWTRAFDMGSAATTLGSDIYIFNTTNLFTKYNAATDTWSNLQNSPENHVSGSALAATATKIYAFRGGNYYDFWEYDISGNNWSSLSSTPKLITPGAKLIYPGSGDYVYAIPANFSNDFWRYSISGNSWDTSSLDQLPFRIMYDRGVSITTDGNNIYLARGGGTKDFWKYDITGNNWSQMPNTPFATGSTSPSEKTGGIVYIPTGPSGGTELYLTTGLTAGASVQSATSLYRFVIADNEWKIFKIPHQLPNNAGGPGTSIVYPGENTSGDKDLYILKGNGTPDFHKYSLKLTEYIPWNRSIFSEVKSTPVAQHDDRSVHFSQTNTTMTEVNEDLYILHYSTAFDKYDPETNSWTELGNAPGSIGPGTTLTAIDNERIIALAGNSSQNIWMYYIPHDRWLSSGSSDAAKLDDGRPVAQAIYQRTYINGTPIAEYNDEFYMAIGGSPSYFIKYNQTENEWIKLASPYEYFNNTSYNFYAGASFAVIGDKIYATSGNSLNFLMYDTSNRAWNILPSIPSGSPSANVYYGGSIAYPGSGDTIYLMKGYNSQQFFKYEITNHGTGEGSWTQIEDTPGAIGTGGSFAIIGSSIYALQGGNNGNLYHYSGGTWTTLSPLPNDIKVGISGGIAADPANETLYVQTGNATRNFLKYTITNNSTGEGEWSIAPNSPVNVGYIWGTATYTGGGLTFYNNGGDPEIWSSPASNTSGADYDVHRFNIAKNKWITVNLQNTPSPISNGGALANPSGSELIYAFRGNNTTEFWSYDIAEGIWNAKYLGKLPDGSTISQDNNSVNHGEGNSIVEVDGIFYVLAGYSSYFFQKYDPYENVWTVLENAPQTVNSSGALVKYDSNTIYAFLTGIYFYEYDIPSNKWILADRGKLTPSSTEAFSPGGTNQGNGNAIAEYGGEIYIIPGGSTGSTVFEKFNPSTNTWTTLPNLPYGIQANGSTLVTVDYGTKPAIYFLTKTGTASSSNMYRFDLTSQTWGTSSLYNETTNVITYGSDAAFSSYDGTTNTSPALYVLRGGGGSIFYKYTFALDGGEIPESGTGTWSTLSTTGAPGISYGASITALCPTCEKLYVLQGGSNRNFWEYDISTSAFTQKASIPIYDQTSTSYGSKIVSDGTYIYFGWGRNDTTFLRYDPSLNEWKIMERMPVNMGGQTSSYYQGALAYCPNALNHCNADSAGIYMTPGPYNTTLDPEPRGLIYKYDMATNTWPHKERAPQSPASLNYGASLAYPGTGYDLFASRGSNTSTFWSYDISNSKWRGYVESDVDDTAGEEPISSVIHQPDQGYGASITRIGNKLYIIPGPSAPAYYEDDQFYSYDISENKWRQLPSVDFITAFGYGSALEAVGNKIFLIEGNNTRGVSVYDTDTEKWERVSSTALGANAYYGADLAYPGTGNYIYASRGYNTNTLYKYDFVTGGSGAWPTVTVSGTAAPAFGGGGALVGIDDGAYGTIYGMRGYNTNTFWKMTMDASGNGTGATLASLPWNVQSGGALTTDGTYIWATRGANTNQFARYNIASNSWTEVTLSGLPATMGDASSTQARGGIIFVPASESVSGTDEIYAITGKGNRFTGPALLYRYIIGTDTWPVTSLLTQPSSNFSYGGTLTGLGDYIYALFGGNTTSFHRYSISGNSWDTSLTQFPVAVRSGGSLTTDGSGNLYASRGNKTGDVYDYNITANTWTLLGASLPSGIGTTLTTDSRGGLAYTDSGPSGNPEIFAVTGNGTYGYNTGDGLIYRYEFSPPAWPMATLPITPPPGNINYGGSLLAMGTDFLYALAGGNTTNFYRYDISGNSWITRAPISTVANGGASLATDGTDIYATSGGALSGFHKYNIAGNSWSALASLPVRMGGQNATTATVDSGEIAYAEGEIWAATGRSDSRWEDALANYDTGLLYRYNIAENTWPYLREATALPATTNTFNSGSGLVSTADGGKIYALRGDSTNAATSGNSNFWEYTVSTDGMDNGSWAQLTNLPNDTTPSAIRAGGSLTLIGDSIFAFTGGGTSDFFKYGILGNTWETQDSLPAPMGNTTVSYDQGALSYVPSLGSIFATPGSGSTIYKFPIVRLIIDPVEEEIYSDGNIQTGEAIKLTVVAVDETDTPYNVPANVNFEIEIKNGSGTLTGTLTGTITSGTNNTVLTGITYNIPESNVILSAVDVTAGAPALRFGTSESDPFTVYASDLSISSVSAADAPSAGNTPLTIQGNNFISHYYRPIDVQNNEAVEYLNASVLVTFNTADAITEGKMKSDCRDIRFTSAIPGDTYGTDPTLLDYQLVADCNTENTTAYVAMYLPSGGNTVIYLNYGDFTLMDESTADQPAPQIILLSDDFTGTTLDSEKWTNNFDAYITVNDKIISTYNAASTDKGFYSKTLIPRNIEPVLTFDFKPINTTSTRYFVMGWKSELDLMGTYNATVANGGFYHGINSNYQSTVNDVFENGIAYNALQSWVSNTQYKIRITLKKTGGALYERSTNDGATWTTYYESIAATNSQARVGFVKYQQAAEIDNVEVITSNTVQNASITEGAENSTFTVEFGEGNYVTPLSSSLFEIKLLTPPDTTGSYPNTVEIILTNSYDSEERVNFTYHKPSILSIVPDSGPAVGETNVNITGLYFTPSRYILPIEITVGEALTNYTHNLSLDSKALAFLGKIRTDMTDLRFYEDAELTTEIDTFWLEGPPFSTASNIWILLSSLLEGTNTIYAVYGDLSLTSLPVNATLANTFTNSVSNVIASWTMDEPYGTDLMAENVSGYDATMYGATATTNIITGKYGNAREMNTTLTDFAYATVDSDTFNLGPDGLSLETWLNIPAYSTATRVIASKLHNPSTSPGPGFRFYLYNGYPYLRLYYGAADSSSRAYGASSQRLSLGSWGHVVWTIEPSTNYVRMYLNGSEIYNNNSFDLSNTSQFGNANNMFSIGSDVYTSKTTSANPFLGGIDELRVYNKVLTPTEVGNLYNNRGYVFPGETPAVYLQEIPATAPVTLFGTETGTINLKIDSVMNAVINASPTLVNFITPPHADGAVEVRITNTDEEYATTTFTYGDASTDPGNSTVVANPATNIEADGTETSLVTVTLLNSGMGPVPSRNVSLTQIDQPLGGTTIITAITCASGGTAGISNNIGKACFTVSTAPASSEGYLGTYEFEAEDVTGSITITQTATIGFIKPIFHEPSSLFTAPAGDVTADGVSTKTATTAINNKNSVGISGQSVTVSQESGPVAATIGGNPGTTNANGEATHTISTTKAGTYTFESTNTSEDPDVTLTDIVTVNFVAGPFSNPDSTTSASKSTVIANTIDSSTVTVTLYDQYENPISGKTVSLAETSGPGGADIVTVQGTTDADGEAIFTVKADTDGTYVFTATNVTDGNTVLTDTETIDFTGPTAANSTVETDTYNVLATGFNKAKITVTMKDAANVRFPSRSITLNKNGGSAEIDAINCSTNASLGTGANAVTNSSGEACYHVTNTVQEAVTFSAYNNNEGFLVTETVEISFGDGVAWGVEELIAGAVGGDFYTVARTQIAQIINPSLEREYVVAWIDRRDNNYAIYAQKFSYNDTTQTIAEEWTPNGILVRNTGSSPLGNLKILSNNSSVVILTWTEEGMEGTDIYVQVLGPYGTLGWTYVELNTTCSAENVWGSLSCYEVIPDHFDSASFGVFLSYQNLTNKKTYITHINGFGLTATGEITTWPVDLDHWNDLNYRCVPIPSMFLYDNLVPAVFYARPRDRCINIPAWDQIYRTYNQTTPIYQPVKANMATYYKKPGISDPSGMCSDFLFPHKIGNNKLMSDNNWGAYLIWKEGCIHEGNYMDNMWLAHLTYDDGGGIGPDSWVAFMGREENFDYNIIAPPLIDGIILSSNIYGTERIDNNFEEPYFNWTLENVWGKLVNSGYNFYVLWNSSDGTNPVVRGSYYNLGGILEMGWETGGNILTSRPSKITISNFPSSEDRYADDNPSAVGTTLDGGVIAAFESTFRHNYRFEDEDTDNFVQGFTPLGQPMNNTGDVIVADPDPPIEESQKMQQIVVTGPGEFVVAWDDGAYDGIYSKIYAEKFDADGNRKWNPDAPGIGKPLYSVFSAGHNYADHKIAADFTGGSGGSKTGGIVEVNYRFGDGTGYIDLQKMNNTGVLQWTTDGYQLASGSGIFGKPTITSDGNGGAYVMYLQNNGDSMKTVWGQNVLSSGIYNASWGAGAQEMVSSSGTRYEYENPVVLYKPGQSTLYLVVQRIDHNNSDKSEVMVYKYSRITGALSGSTTIATTAGSQFFTNAYLDPTGNYIYILFYDQGGNLRIQKIGVGLLAESFGSAGQIITSNTSEFFFSNPSMALDATGSPLVTWERWNSSETQSDIVVTRINGETGTPLWGEKIITDTLNPIEKELPKIVSDGGTGAFVVWEEKNASETAKNIYTQHIVGSFPQDTEYGVAITTSGPLNYGTEIAGDDSKGVFITWQKSSSPPDIYGQYYVQMDGFGLENNSSFVTSKEKVLPNGTDYAILTATVMDDIDSPVVGDTIEVEIIAGSTSGVAIDAINCTTLVSLGTGNSSVTDTNGEACFRVTATTEDIRTFAANDITQSATIPETPTVAFGLYYCEPPEISGTADYGITNFTLDSAPAINNDSSIAFPGYSPYDPLQDFTKTVTAGGLYKTVTYQSSITHPSAQPTKGYIWIDYNMDGDFEGTGEEVAFYSDGTGSTVNNFSEFSVPGTATEGTTTMRVGTSATGATLDPCGASANAEYEDYLIDIDTLTPSTTNSSFGAVPLTIPADDTTTSTLYVTVKNESDIPIPGEDITIAAWGGGAIPGNITVVPDPTTPQTTDENGQVTYTVRSGTPQTQAFEATIAGTGTITEGPSVEFTYPDFTVSTFTADPLLIAADGTETSKLHATILDVASSPFQNTSVTITDSPISDTPTVSYDEIDCDTESVITADSNVGTTNSSGEVCFFITSTTYGTSEFTATAKSIALYNQPQVQFYGEPSALNTTLAADPLYAPADGATPIILTATVKDGSTIGYPTANEEVSLTQTMGPGTANITAIDCPSPEPAGSSPGTTNVNGKACFRVTSVTQGTIELTAEVVSNSVTASTTVTFGCVAGPNQQCILVNIGDGTGVLTLDIPSNFDFPSTGVKYDPLNAQESFSFLNATYGSGGNDIVRVTDTRSEGGFELQIQASAFAETLTMEQVPLQNLFIATKASITGGLQLNGIEYGTGNTPAEEVSAQLDASGNLDTASTFTSILPGGMGTGGTGTVIVLQDGSVSTEPGRYDTFSQIVHYFLNIPAGQLPGNYQVTLSFDLIAT